MSGRLTELLDGMKKLPTRALQGGRNLIEDLSHLPERSMQDSRDLRRFGEQLAGQPQSGLKPLSEMLGAKPGQTLAQSFVGAADGQTVGQKLIGLAPGQSLGRKVLDLAPGQSLGAKLVGGQGGQSMGAALMHARPGQSAAQALVGAKDGVGVGRSLMGMGAGRDMSDYQALTQSYTPLPQLPVKQDWSTIDDVPNATQAPSMSGPSPAASHAQQMAQLSMISGQLTANNQPKGLGSGPVDEQLATMMAVANMRRSGQAFQPQATFGAPASFGSRY